MKSIALLAATAMVFFSAAWAQSEVKPLPPEPPKPAAQAPAKPATQEAAKPVSKPSGPMSSARKARRSEDARHCLERPSNNEIIKCAEAYL